MVTHVTKKNEVVKDWYLIDAKGLILGRLASNVAKILMGKNKPTYAHNVDAGDNVVVTNISKITVTGKKPEQKMYYTYSGYPGGLRTTSYKKMLKEKPEEVLYLAVRGMLPKNKLRDKLMKKLHIYKDEKHTHSAQKPKEIKL